MEGTKEVYSLYRPQRVSLKNVLSVGKPRYIRLTKTKIFSQSNEVLVSNIHGTPVHDTK